MFPFLPWSYVSKFHSAHWNITVSNHFICFQFGSASEDDENDDDYDEEDESEEDDEQYNEELSEDGEKERFSIKT